MHMASALKAHVQELEIEAVFIPPKQSRTKDDPGGDSATRRKSSLDTHLRRPAIDDD